MNFQYPIEDFRVLHRNLVGYLLTTHPIHTGEWQAMDTSKSAAHATYELEDITLRLHNLPPDVTQAQGFIQPDLPWAEDHFQERVSGIPHNPAPSHNWWPYAVRGNADHITSLRFDHTYPERFWPKHAGHEHDKIELASDAGPVRELRQPCFHPLEGIRFDYGDLLDVAALLARSPHTRQAYLPVWFPEDTGAVSGQRVPCTLGYHFMIRSGRLTCRYYIRSCDAYRHMVNDVYLAVRLTQWICDRLNTLEEIRKNPIVPGDLIMHISSLHGFVGDRQKLEGIAYGHLAPKP